MKKFKMELQFFGEGGGDGAGAGAGSTSTGSGTEGMAEGDLASQGSDETTVTESKSQAFERLIKTEYKDEYSKRVQNTINDRFKHTKGLEESMKSLDPVLKLMGEKYGVDPKDIKALSKAIEEDDSYYEQEAYDKGLTVSQLKEMKKLQRENEAFRQAQEEQETKKRSQEIYGKWMDDFEVMNQRYGLNSSLEQEVRDNPQFVDLLKRGIDVEAAYKVTHMDDMIGGAMAKTAENVRRDIARSVSTRNSRPAENATSTSSGATFKTDVNAMSKADRASIMQKALRGERIVL